MTADDQSQHEILKIGRGSVTAVCGYVKKDITNIFLSNNNISGTANTQNTSNWKFPKLP
jgi:hypothetical protein